MFSEAKVTEIYCLADDFCKEFARHQENYMLKNKNVKHRIAQCPPWSRKHRTSPGNGCPLQVPHHRSLCPQRGDSQ